MPRASKAPVWRQYTQLQRCPIMGAIGTHSVGFVGLLDQEDLAILNAFDLDFTLLSVLKVKPGKTLELEFLSHCS